MNFNYDFNQPIPRGLLPRVKKSSRMHLIQTAHVVIFDRDGKPIDEEWTEPNMLHDEGEQYILSRAYATALVGFTATPANVYLGLDTRASLAEADTLASLTGEPTTGGYARQALSTGGTGAGGQDFVVGTSGAYYKLTSKTVTFTHNTSGASWTGLLNMFLTDHLSATTSGAGQRLHASVALSTSRTIANTGESLACTMYVGLSE